MLHENHFVDPKPEIRSINMEMSRALAYDLAKCTYELYDPDSMREMHHARITMLVGPGHIWGAATSMGWKWR